MATTETLPPDARKAVVAQIGKILAYRHGRWDAPIHTASLRESFSIWRLDPRDLSRNRASSQISAVAQRTDGWHHQLCANHDAWLFARSTGQATRPAGWKVEHVSSAKLASHVASAIDVIDRDVPEDLLVRLLIVPVLDVEALWIVGNRGIDDRLTPIDLPVRFANLEYQKLYGSREFHDAIPRS